MSDTKLTQEDVQQILQLIEKADHIAEFRLKFADVEIAVSRTNSGSAVLSAAADILAPPPSAEPQPAAAGRSKDPLPDDSNSLKAPMVGTFYRSPSPGTPPFVEVGQKVEVDTTICIIEVMKLMNSIAAGVRGTVSEFRATDGQPVEFGQVLVVIQPDH